MKNENEVNTDIVVDIFEDDILKYGTPLLDILLKDRTTRKNIIWATNDYIELGEYYSAQCEIKSHMITKNLGTVIQPRITKSSINQTNRTREKAEVFTPTWICNEQNNLLDEKWFGRKDVFNKQSFQSWEVNHDKIIFPEKNGKDWRNYVDSRRMEISCGEAPYLVSRYDPVSGKIFKISERIGLLDRKLRVINENVNEYHEWFKWTQRAFQSVYGFEYQGDSLLLARENLLYAFIDNLVYMFNRQPLLQELMKVANIISWNIWQMDGITLTVPMCDKREWLEQLKFFEFNEKRIDRKKCLIRDWRSKLNIEYSSIIGEGK